MLFLTDWVVYLVLKCLPIIVGDGSFIIVQILQ